MHAVSSAANGAEGGDMRDKGLLVPVDEGPNNPEPRVLTPHYFVVTPAETQTAIVVERAQSSSHIETTYSEENTSQPHDDPPFEAVYPTGTIRRLLAIDF